MDQILIADLAVQYHVGVPEEERAQAQRLLLTVVMDHDFSKAAAGDDLSETMDYYAVSRRLLSFGNGRSWKLIETLAVDIAAMIQTEYHAVRVEVEVKKFILPEAQYVAVRVIRPIPSPSSAKEK